MRGRLRGFLTGYFRNNLGLLLFVSLFFLLGIVAGTLAVQLLSGDQANSLVQYLDSFLNGLHNQPIDNQLLAERSILNNLQVVLAIWFLGLTVIGIPLIVIIVFLRAFVFGFTVGFLVEKKAWQGIAFACFSILPQSLLFIPALILAGVAAVSFSLFLIGGRSPTRTGRLSGRFVSYCLFMLFLSAVAAAAGLVEAYITPVFIKLLATW